MKFFILFCVLFASLSIVGLSSDAFAECSLSDTCHAYMQYNPSTSIQGLEYQLDSPDLYVDRNACDNTAVSSGWLMADELKGNIDHEWMESGVLKGIIF